MKSKLYDRIKNLLSLHQTSNPQICVIWDPSDFEHIEKKLNATQNAQDSTEHIWPAKRRQGGERRRRQKKEEEKKEEEEEEEEESD